MLGPENCRVTSLAPAASESTLRVGPEVLTYWTSVNPSAFRKASATNTGAMHTEMTFTTGIRMVVVSSFSTAAVGEAGLAPQASSKARPAADRPRPPAAFNNWRRLRPSRTPTLGRADFILFLPGASSRAPVNSISTGWRRRRGDCRQLRLKLVEETPVGALLDDLVRRALDRPDTTQEQRIKSDGVFGVILPPAVVGDVLHGLERVVVRGCHTLIHH